MFFDVEEGEYDVNVTQGNFEMDKIKVVVGKDSYKSFVVIGKSLE